MTRTELIETLAQTAGTEKRDAKVFLEALTTVVENTIRAGGEVPLKGLGKFKVQNRQARMGRNPQTGEAIKIKASKSLRFRPAASLRRAAGC